MVEPVDKSGKISTASLKGATDTHVSQLLETEIQRRDFLPKGKIF